MAKSLLFLLFAVNVFAQEAKIGIVEEDIKGVDGSEIEREYIQVQLIKPNENIEFVARVSFQVLNGSLHVNGHRLNHNIVHSIQMMVLITDINNGVKSLPRRKSVEMRVLVEETRVNGAMRLFVEEEFISIGLESVEQIEVKQLVWEDNVRVQMLSVKVAESKIHSKPRSEDHKMFISDENSVPHLPNEEQTRRPYCDEVDHRNSTYAKQTRCLFRRLTWKTKVALFSLGFCGLLTAVLCCAMCAKRREHHRALNISVPMDNNTECIDMDDVDKAPKKTDDGKFEFHFEFDNSVVVDDRKQLVEDA